MTVFLFRLEYSLGLHKRTDLNSLYNSVPNPNKVPVGGARPFTLDLTKSTSYSTAYFYGCTVVFTVDGNGIIIGHFAQEMAKPGTNGQESCTAMKNAAVVQKNIIDKLEDVEAMLDFTDNTHAWILTSSGTSTTSYRLIKEHFVTNELPAENIRPYVYTATSAFSDFHEGLNGKAVLEERSFLDQMGVGLRLTSTLKAIPLRRHKTTIAMGTQSPPLNIRGLPLRAQRQEAQHSRPHRDPQILLRLDRRQPALNNRKTPTKGFGQVIAYAP